MHQTGEKYTRRCQVSSPKLGWNAFLSWKSEVQAYAGATQHSTKTIPALRCNTFMPCRSAPGSEYVYSSSAASPSPIGLVTSCNRRYVVLTPAAVVQADSSAVISADGSPAREPRVITAAA